jgi:hypothetical protein
LALRCVASSGSPRLDRTCHAPIFRVSAKIALILSAALAGSSGHAQVSPEQQKQVRGIVVNSSTREPIGHALVYSADRRFATLTDDQGRFQFDVPTEASAPSGDAMAEIETHTMEGSNSVEGFASIFPHILMARKPGFLSTDKGRSPWDTTNVEPGKDVTIALVPEARVVGRVALPSSNASDHIAVHLYRRHVFDGRARWELEAEVGARSSGEFRFAGLEAGNYKVFTGELIDRDPLTFNPAGPVYGYPPSYFPDASNFQAAAEIHLAAGMTFQADLSPVRQPYYNVKLPLANAPASDQVLVSVATQGKKGPGFELGYNPRDQRVEGSLPNGTYLIEAMIESQKGASASATIAVKGSPVEGPALTFVPNGSVQIQAKLGFPRDNRNRSMDTANVAGNSSTEATDAACLQNRDFSFQLEPADEFTHAEMPNGPSSVLCHDDSTTFVSVPPGRYWLKLYSPFGFASSMRAGNVDLLRQPLTVQPGANLRVEVEVRNDGAEVSGSVEGAQAEKPAVSTAASHARGFLYCIPLPDSPGQSRQTPVGPDGSFLLEQLPPGSYRLLVFDRPQNDIEFRNAEAMRAFENKGQVVGLHASQKEHVILQVMTSNE